MNLQNISLWMDIYAVTLKNASKAIELSRDCSKVALEKAPRFKAQVNIVFLLNFIVIKLIKTWNWQK